MWIWNLWRVGGLTNNWQEVDDLALDYTTQGDFLRYYRKLNYRGAAKFRFVRDNDFQAYGYTYLDDQFLVVDNIQVSYPAPYVEMQELSSTLSSMPDFSGSLAVCCMVDQYNADYSDLNNTAVDLWYRIAPEQGSTFSAWTNISLIYVEGTGNGEGIGREYQGELAVQSEGEIEYYYECSFDGSFEAQDYTGTGVNYPFPAESLSPVSLYEDGMGGTNPLDMHWAFGSVPPVTELSDDRILTFDDYYDAAWTHTGDSAPPRTGRTLLDGTFHIHDTGWCLSEVRAGSAKNYGLVVPVVDFSNYAGNLRNVAGAYIESPFYTNGVGTVYFDVVNGENPPDAGPMLI